MRIFSPARIIKQKPRKKAANASEKSPHAKTTMARNCVVLGAKSFNTFTLYTNLHTNYMMYRFIHLLAWFRFRIFIDNNLFIFCTVWKSLIIFTRCCEFFYCISNYVYVIMKVCLINLFDSIHII